MRGSLVWVGLSGVVLAALGCGGSDAVSVTTPDAASDVTTGRGRDGGASLCVPCTTGADCASGSVCAQFAGDTFCAPQCPNGDECGAATSCSLETSYAGDQVSLCVPTGDVCGSSVGPITDGGSPSAPSGCDAGAPGACGTLVGPASSAACNGCGTHACQPNGCYGGWWCDSATNKCKSPPATCSGGAVCGGGGADSGPIDIDAGGPVTGTVGPGGGSVSRLYFTAVGDTRPANEDDTAGYPTTIIDQIYGDIAALNPVPPFSISTGDYQFSNPAGAESASQIQLYLAARAKYPGAFFPALGNHECTGATASNCGAGNTNGTTTNYDNFLSLMLGPIQKTLPYYTIAVNALDSSWTSKFVFVAANAWDSAQSSWLSGVMAQPTTYTFVVRHEATGTSGPPGVSPSDAIINGFPYTLLIVGHTHSYGHKSTKEVLFGNGGAPLTGSGNYGYGLFSQRSDGAVVVDAIDYLSGKADASFHFAVTPSGAVTP